MGRLFTCLLVCSLAALSACAGPPKVDQRFVQALTAPYLLDSGDRLRIVVFNQPSLSNTYTVDASGFISVPLIGDVQARGQTTGDLETTIAARLRAGYLREPSVTVQVDTYRPFFIMGEVRAPGQYPYVAGLTARTAVAIGGGFSPRAVQDVVVISRQIDGTIVEARVPADHPVRPGDTIYVLERWF
jgi:polysaccharide export outer membrane protein